jgi:hypothetical protein
VRSVILRSRPGRPWWQLTTRPATAVVLGVVSLLAAGAQVALLSSPTPWYQPVVVGFWAVVGLAFLGSAAGTRTRARRAAEARLRVPVDSLPFVPVPVRPARPRRREVAREDALDVGEPTEDLADAVQTAVTPVVTAVAPAPAVVPAVAPSDAGDAEPTEHVTRGHRRSRSGERPTGLLNRHAVRAVRSVESASRGVPVVPAVSPATVSPATPTPSPAATPSPASAEPTAMIPTPAAGWRTRRAQPRPGLTGETIGIRDGRVRPRPDANVGPRHDAPARPRRDTVEPAAPDGAVPSQRRAPEGTGPKRHAHPAGPRPAAARVDGPVTGDAVRAASSLSFGGGERGDDRRGADRRGADRRGADRRGADRPAPTDTGRHAMVEPRDLPRPRHADTGTVAPRPARHAAPPARDRVR